MARAGRSFSLGAGRIEAGTVAIRRLREASVLDPATGGFTAVAGTDRVQVNLTLGGEVPAGRWWGLRVRLAMPLLNRPMNVDGLTRALSLDLGAAWRFEGPVRAAQTTGSSGS